jgi:hypothetical protein
LSKNKADQRAVTYQRRVQRTAVPKKVGAIFSTLSDSFYRKLIFGRLI